jgi:hypothetical protein
MNWIYLEMIQWALFLNYIDCVHYYSFWKGILVKYLKLLRRFIYKQNCFPWINIFSSNCFRYKTSSWMLQCTRFTSICRVIQDLNAIFVLCWSHTETFSFEVVGWFCLFVDLWVLPFPLEDCSVFGNFVITLIWYSKSILVNFIIIINVAFRLILLFYHHWQQRNNVEYAFKHA